MNRTIMAATFITALALLPACGGNTAPTSIEPAPSTQTVLPPTALPTETDSPTPSETPPQAEESAQPTIEAGGANQVSFSTSIMPILEAKCIKCHGVERIKEGLDLRTYETIMAGSFNGVVVLPGNAGESLLVQLIVEGEMPNRGTKITPEELQLIQEWVNQGALNN